MGQGLGGLDDERVELRRGEVSASGRRGGRAAREAEACDGPSRLCKRFSPARADWVRVAQSLAVELKSSCQSKGASQINFDAPDRQLSPPPARPRPIPPSQLSGSAALAGPQLLQVDR